MKVVSLALLLSAPFVLSAAEVQRGASLDEVRSALDAPQGQVRLGDRHLLYYARGEVELRGGAVTRVALLSPEEQSAREAQRAADAGRVREEQEISRARLTAEGEALKARKLADPAFQSAPPAYQVAFWEDFSRRYADVPGAEQLMAARMRLAEQVEAGRIQVEQALRIADLEARLIAVESRADESRRGSYGSIYGGYYPRRHSFNLWPVEYHFNDGLPQPFVSSSRRPAVQPGTGRGWNDGVAHGLLNNDRRDGRTRTFNSNRSSSGFDWRNRL
jgi:hypothetical protein